MDNFNPETIAQKEINETDTPLKSSRDPLVGNNLCDNNFCNSCKYHTNFCPECGDGENQQDTADNEKYAEEHGPTPVYAQGNFVN